MDEITRFSNEYDFLSNMYYTSEDKSSEHYYQAGKATNAIDHQYVLDADTPEISKRRGREIKCRPDWDKVKDMVMYSAVLYKFSSNRELGIRLMETYPLHILEGNFWHDNYWGDCSCARGKCTNIPGENNLGKILMQVRDKLIVNMCYDLGNVEDL